MIELEPLNLHYPCNNVLVAVLVRIEHELGRLDQHYDWARALPQTLRQGPDTSNVLQELRVVSMHAALGYPGNLRERRGHLDPDCYAVEVNRTEFSRMDFRRQYLALLDKLNTTFSIMVIGTQCPVELKLLQCDRMEINFIEDPVGFGLDD